MCSNQYLKTTIRQPPINQKLINTFVIVVYIQINSSSRSYSGIKKIRKTVTKTVLKNLQNVSFISKLQKMLDGVFQLLRASLEFRQIRHLKPIFQP